MQAVHKEQIQALIKDQHDEQLLLVEDQRQLDFVAHTKKVRALERKKTDKEKEHERMITAQDRLVKCQDKQLSYQKLEMREKQTKFEQEVKELREFGAVQLREQYMEHKKGVKELKSQFERM